MASRTCSSVGFGFSASSAAAASTWAGVQKPHWMAPWSMKAFCSVCRLRGEPNPSIVVMAAPSHCTARRVHEFISTPSTRTAQAPQVPSSQPCLTPR